MLLLPVPYPQLMWQARQLKLARLLQKPLIGKWETRPKPAEPRGWCSFPWQWRLLEASTVSQLAWWGALGKLWQEEGVWRERTHQPTFQSPVSNTDERERNDVVQQMPWCHCCWGGWSRVTLCILSCYNVHLSYLFSYYKILLVLLRNTAPFGVVFIEVFTRKLIVKSIMKSPTK